MIFTQYYLECLSQASYLVGDETTGRAVVVDPRRDVDEYVRDAEAAGLRIERIIETHVHADFLSGHLELAARTGATIGYGEDATVDYPIEPLRDGQRLVLGDVVLEIRLTPGHTPESICIVVYEHAGDAVPYGVLTGDTLFIGDVGRPDLLVSSGSTADELARQLYHSIHEQLLTLPDDTRVFPAHGAGSACGKQLSTETQSTIGEQRKTNYALAPMSEDEFVVAVTEGQPLKPAYFSFDARLNREDRALLDEAAPVPELPIDEVLRVQAWGAALLDGREHADFARGHLHGAINVGLAGRFAEYVGEVLRPDQDIVLVGDPATAAEAKLRLGRIGFDRVVGQLADPAHVAEQHPERWDRSSRVTVEYLAEALGAVDGLQLVDVRAPGETRAGTIRGAHLIPLPQLRDSLGTLDPRRPAVVFCAGGYRSSIAASVLDSAGFVDASDLLGGFNAWAGLGLPVVHPDGERESTMNGSEVQEVDADEGNALVKDGAMLLDVREPDEWVAGHATAATWIPMKEVQARVDELPKDRRIVAICRSGGRSAAVAEALQAWGYDAVNLQGGMRAWVAAGHDCVADDGSPGQVI